MGTMVRLLGEVTVEADGGPVDLGAPKQRCILAVLALEAGQVVAVDRLVERVWGAEISPRTRTTLHSYISRLRTAMSTADGITLSRRSGGYVLDIAPALSTVDYLRHRELRADARADETRAVPLLNEALELWRGVALTGLTGEWAEAERERLERERLATRLELVDTLLRLGLGEELVAELAARAAEHPLDERTAGQYMLALHQAGRTADALRHYQLVRGRLIEELGVDPAATLQETHRKLLVTAPPPAHGSYGADAEPVVPRQLPAAPASFVGRRSHLSNLDELPGDTGTVVIAAIAGAGGIGKTWLALNWAHRHADRFPDGRLFVDLRGFGPEAEPMTPAVAVRGFLDALGVPPGRIPPDPHAQAALYRSLIADKRMLLVLDNAAGTAQVTPLLPGSPACTVLVTSRNRLSGLITGHGARYLQLDVLTETEARALLADRLGEERLLAGPAAAEELVELCGGYPLALSIIAGQAHSRPDVPLSVFADELRELGLDALEDSDPTASLPTVLSWSRRALTPDQAMTFALLAIAPGTDISLAAATSLAGCFSAAARSRLRGLEDASLITRDARGRYGMHDLIRHYARDVAQHDLTDEERDEALHRLLDFYVHTGATAELLLTPDRQTIRLDLPAPECRPQALPDATAAVAWLTAEYANLRAAQLAAAALGWHREVWQIAWVLSTFEYYQGDPELRRAVWQLALKAAEHLGDVSFRSYSHTHLGRVLAELGSHEEALEHLHRSLELADRQENLTVRAYAHYSLGYVWLQHEVYRTAIEHSHRALEAYRALEDPVWEAVALNQLGWCFARIAEYDTAREHLQASFTLSRQHTSATNKAHTLGNLGYVAHHTGRHEEALDYYAKSLTLLRGVGDLRHVAVALDWSGQTHQALGHHEQARAAWEEALVVYREQGRDQAADQVQARLTKLTTHSPRAT